VSDVIQSVCADVVRDIHAFRGDDGKSFLAWISRILDNKIRAKGRYFSARRRQAIVEALTDDDSPLATWQSRTPSQELCRQETFNQFVAALQNLPDDYRDALLLRGVEDKSAREIGLVLGRTEQATRMLLSRARAALSLEIDRLRRVEPG